MPKQTEFDLDPYEKRIALLEQTVITLAGVLSDLSWGKTIHEPGTSYRATEFIYERVIRVLKGESDGSDVESHEATE